MSDRDEALRARAYAVDRPNDEETFNVYNLQETSEEEVEGHLRRYLYHVRTRGQFYGLNALAFLADARPDFAKLAARGMGGLPEGLVGHPARPVLQNIRVLAQYTRLGWESGIYNEFRELQMRGMSRAQILEVVLYAQLSGGGIRSMGHVHNAVGKSLLDWRDGDGPVFPDGWAADPGAFASGLDLSSGSLSEADRKGIEGWYEKTIGWVPKSVRFAAAHNPRFLKSQRAKWESVFRTLPKQVAPYLMVAQHAVTGHREGLREGALLGKAWGMDADWVVESVCGMAYYFTGMEALEAAYDALDDILTDWDR